MTWHRAARPLVAVTAGAALAGCAAGPTGTSGNAPSDQRYAVSTTVLESPDHGPQLCLGGVAESYPPQCGGPDVVGFDWAEVAGEESAAGTTWGQFTLTGTWDGERLTLTEPPAPWQPVGGEPPGDPFATPCPAPDGGWAVVDPSRAAERDLDAAIAFARAQPTHGGVWLDRLDVPGEPVREEPLDPAAVVLNLRSTGDLDALEGRVRQLWGGPMCITRAERTHEELLAVQQELHRGIDGLLSSSVDEVRGVVEVTVPVVDEEVRQRIAALDPHGVVRPHGLLQPVP